MPLATLNTIDLPDLIEKIKSSVMGEKEKQTLMEVLEQANETQKAQILALIEGSNAEADKIKKEHELAVGDINQTYQKKLDILVKEEKTRAYRAFEKLEEDDKVRAMMDIDREIADVKEAETVSTTPTITKKKSHPVRLVMMVLLALGALAAGAWGALKFLS